MRQEMSETEMTVAKDLSHQGDQILDHQGVQVKIDHKINSE